MKALILLASVVLVTSSPVVERPESPTYNNLTYFLVELSPGVYRRESLIGKSQYTAVDSDIKVYFHNKKSGDHGLVVDLTDAKSLASTEFSLSLNTIFIIHGWINDHNAPVNEDIRRAYLSNGDANIFVVDWSKIAKLDYISAAQNVKDLGDLLGGYIKNMVNDAGLDLSKTVLIGHSLGAHIAGVAGKICGSQANHIVGLDPAGPLFTLNNKENRIEPSSAKFVQIIHTCAGLLGFDHELGHADYWPNGGKSQPGCGIDVAGSCSHSRSFEYFAESIKTGKFVAETCADWKTYESGSCKSNAKSNMGQSEVDTKAKGSYFLETNSHQPFAKGG